MDIYIEFDKKEINNINLFYEIRLLMRKVLIRIRLYIIF